MSLRPIALLSSALMTGAAAMLLAPTGVEAGQYKTLSTETLAAGGFQVLATSSPKNSGNAMELDVYEFKVGANNAFYRCKITANATGQPLEINLIRVDGGVIGSCVAAAGGACNTAFVQFPVANNKPLCLVNTGPNLPVVGANPTYTMAVQRQ